MKRVVRFTVAFFIFLLYAGWANALTPEQVIQLKKAGVSEETIRVMIDQERAGRQPSRSDRIGVREVRDAEGNTSVIYSTGAPAAPGPDDPEREKVEKAWKMLQNQNMIIDDRRR